MSDKSSSGSGRFVREPSAFRNWITPDGARGPTGEPGFAAERDRYHLYVSYACPWAHRTLILRALKQLEPFIGLSVVHWHMGAEGWSFEAGPGVIADPVLGARRLRDVYAADGRAHDTRATTPVLWDKVGRRIVSNESADITRMFNAAFDGLGVPRHDYYPAELRPDIDALEERIYEQLNNGVYKAGFATTQAAYDEAARGVFSLLDELEARLGKSRYLFGARLTEADVRTFVTLIRFDVVYHGHFKCNLRRISDYPALFAYTRDIFQIPAIRATVNFDHIKRHYYESHPRINPTGIVPIGPDIDFDAPHDRASLG